MRVWLPALRAGTGVDVFTRRLEIALRARGVETEITWFPSWYEFFPELMRLHRVPPGTDVIHANGWLASPFVGRGVPVVTTVHHLVHDEAYSPYRSVTQALFHRWHIRWRELRALRGSDAVTSVSTYVAGTVRSFCGRDDVAAIHNWVDIARFAPSPTPSGDTARAFRLLIVGCHSRRKGSDLLPELAAALASRFELRCTGGPRDVGKTAMHGVHWLGRLSESDLIKEFQHCDVVVTLSRYEGFGYTALEGMACAKPVVAFRTSSLVEVIDEGVTGFLETIDDVDAIAERCAQLEADCELKSRMGSAGRQRAVAAFSEAEAVDAYLRVYAVVTGKR